MKIGDLVRVTSKNNDYFGEIGIVTSRLNNFFIYAMIPSGEFIFSPEALKVIAEGYLARSGSLDRPSGRATTTTAGVARFRPHVVR